MQLSDPTADLSIESSLDKLLFVFASLVFISISPYFIWSNQVIIYQFSHLIGNSIIIYIFIRYYNFNFHNKEVAFFFFIIALYSMVAGTIVQKYTYIPLISLLFITLNKDNQLRIFNYVVLFLVIVYSFGLVSYLLSLVHLNKQLGFAIAPNAFKQPYAVFFGHVEEKLLYNEYRFSSIFDEAGVVGTLNGLILSAIGISKLNYKSIILLIAGLISFSLAFYIILLLNLLFTFNLKRILIVIILFLGIVFFTGDKFEKLIASRFVIENGTIAGDNRTHEAFEIYYNQLFENGGPDLIFGRGKITAENVEELEGPSSYKVVIVRYGLVGISLFVLFYAFCVYYCNNSLKGWFLFLVFIISAYQRPDFLTLFNIVLFLGGLRYIKEDSDMEKEVKTVDAVHF